MHELTRGTSNLKDINTCLLEISDQSKSAMNLLTESKALKKPLRAYQIKPTITVQLTPSHQSGA
jgi:hypothetical protein